MRRLICHLLVVAALCGAGGALATIEPPVQVRILGAPRAAEPGGPFVGQLQIESGIPAILGDLKFSGARWQQLSLAAAPAEHLDQGKPLHGPDGVFEGYIGSCLEISGEGPGSEQLAGLGLHPRRPAEGGNWPGIAGCGAVLGGQRVREECRLLRGNREMVPGIADRIGRLDPARQRHEDSHAGHEDVHAINVLDRLNSQQDVHLGGDDGAGGDGLFKERAKQWCGVGAVGHKLVGRRRPRRYVLGELADDLVGKVATVAS